MPFPTTKNVKLYRITILARKGADHSYQLWLDDVTGYIARVQKMLRENDWAKEKYYGAHVQVLNSKGMQF